MRRYSCESAASRRWKFGSWGFFYLIAPPRTQYIFEKFKMKDKVNWQIWLSSSELFLFANCSTRHSHLISLGAIFSIRSHSKVLFENVDCFTVFNSKIPYFNNVPGNAEMSYYPILHLLLSRLLAFWTDSKRFEGCGVEVSGSILLRKSNNGSMIGSRPLFF